jgi:hypothetical protein
MHHHSAWVDPIFWQKMALSPFGLWFVSIVVFCAQKSGLYGRRKGFQVRYAKPMQQRISFLIFTASLPWIATDFGPFSTHWPMWTVFGILLPSGLVYLSGPNEVTFDLDRRSYTAKFGWPFAPKVWAGPLADVSHFNVGCSGGTCYLIVRWKPKRMGIMIGSFGSKAKAEAAAAEVTKLLGLDIPIKAAGSTSRSVPRI